ncbi:MAG TPA: pilin [Patescibacteria group bacterium]|nr:pilin [Patescibacteria group bacterium]
MRKILLISILFLSTVILTTPDLVFAQDPKPVDIFHDVCKDPSTSGSTACEDADTEGRNPIYGPDGIITSIVNLLSVIIAIAAVVGLIVAAIKMIGNGNQPEEVVKARDLMIYAIVGLVLAAMAQALVKLVLQRIFFDP